MARSLTCWRYPWARARTRIGRGWPRRGWNRARCSLLCSVGTRANQPAMPVPARVGNGVATRVSTSASSDAAETWAPAKRKQKQQFFIVIPYHSYRLSSATWSFLFFRLFVQYNICIYFFYRIHFVAVTRSHFEFCFALVWEHVGERERINILLVLHMDNNGQFFLKSFSSSLNLSFLIRECKSKSKS